MAKKRGANRASAGTAANSTPPRARRPSAETQAALADAVEAMTPPPVGPTSETAAALAAAAPRHRSASGEFAVVAGPERSRAPSDALALVAPVVPVGAMVQPTAISSSTIIVQNAAMVGARPSTPAPRAASAVVPVAAAQPAAAAESFSDLDEAFFASDVSDQTLTSERERGEQAAKPWWRRLLGL